MIGFVETISNAERQNMLEQLTRTKPEDLNNTLEIEDDTECSEIPEFNFEFKIVHTEQLVPNGIEIR